MKHKILAGWVAALVLGSSSQALAQGAATPVQTYNGLELSVTGVERASSAALSDCPPGANTQRGVTRPGEQFALVTLRVRVLPDFEATPIPRPRVTGSDGETYFTAASFVDVASEPEYSCVFPFRVPEGTRLTSFQVEDASFDLSGVEGAPLPTSGADEDPWFGTFSIIVYDPATNQHGVAVQSRAFAAGAAVPYAKAGVGAVATQAAANRLYGPKAIALLEEGLSPEEVVKRITDEDAMRDRRQVAVMDAQGRAAVYTGRTVINRNSDPNDLVHLGAWAGHVIHTNIAAQGNTLASEAVVRAMVEAYVATDGEMAEKLMAALEAGQDQGGDIRGMQSAGILVVRPIAGYPNNTNERVVDIRVDDAADPYTELRRVLDVRLSRRHVQRSAELADQGSFNAAVLEQRKAYAMNPRSERIVYTLGQRYAQAGEYLHALLALNEAIGKQPRLKEQAAGDPVFREMREMVEFQQLVGG